MSGGTTITTPLCTLLGIKHPIILAGMDRAASPDLAAAVSNAGGLGVIGGFGMSPEFLTEQLNRLKAQLVDKNAPFGVDLLIPQVGGNARKTNKDYTRGNLDILIDIIIKQGAKLFVSAVGVPPKHIVDKLHANGIAVMNMIGHPKHVSKALEVGVDILCAQGTEGGGHTGDITTSILIPVIVDECRGKISSFTGKPISVVAAGGIFNGRGLAAMLSYGAQGVWIGTRFLLAEESGAPRLHRENVIKAGFDETIRTLIWSGRPMRVWKDKTVMEWETTKQEQIKQLTSQGIVPMKWEKDRRIAEGSYNFMDFQYKHIIMGAAAGALTAKHVQPAKVIIDEMIAEACESIRNTNKMMISKL